MNDQQYTYQALTRLISTGYPGEEVNTIPANAPQMTTSALSGSQTYEYYYRDSDSLNNDQSSRVVIKVTDNWTASFNEDNQVILTVTTQVDSIVRDDIRGNPALGGSGRRNIYLRFSTYGNNLATFLNDDIRFAHTISGPINIGTNTMTLNPSAGTGSSALTIFNTVPGHEGDALPNLYTDVLGVGTYFTNPMPADYRPMAVWTGFGWGSCNLPAGWVGTYDGASYAEARTQDGGTGTGNPPLGFNGSAWVNQYKEPSQ